jgi:hypothetical protein
VSRYDGSSAGASVAPSTKLDPSNSYSQTPENWRVEPGIPTAEHDESAAPNAIRVIHLKVMAEITMYFDVG